MDSQAKSSLLGTKGQIVGLGFGEHPLKPNYFINPVLYRTPDQWVLCFGEGPGKGDPAVMRTGLGQMVEGYLFAPYAGRGIDGRMEFSVIRKILSESTDAVWEWMSASNLQYGRE